MKVFLLAVAVLATIASSSAVDEECVQRKLRGLPMHWPNPSDCGSFYRCTNKSVKRHILCPAGKEYNIKSGRCGAMGRNLCMLSLRLALDGVSNPCTNVLSGTWVADAKNCRNFYICNKNLAYPQSCDAGSYFNNIKTVCVPDTESQCWENLCLDKANGVYIPNENDCYSFYICYNKAPVAQECSSGGYFDKETLNCRPGVCPADATTTTTTTTTKASTASTERPEDTTATTRTITTTAATTYTLTPIITTTPRGTDQTTTTSKTENTTTTPRTEVTTTPEVTTPCDDDTTTQEVTTPCDDDTTTPEVTTPCDDDKITPEITTSCDDYTTTPDVTTPWDDDTTTPNVTTPCDDDTTTSPGDDSTTPPDETCAKTNCDQAKCANAADLTIFPSLNNNNKLFCMCINNEAVCRNCPEGSEFLPIYGACFATQETTSADDDTTTCATTPSTVEDTTSTPWSEVNTTLKVTTPCDDDTTTHSDDDTTTSLGETCAKTNCEQAECLNAADIATFPALNGNNKLFCMCINNEAVCRKCPEGSAFLPINGACFATQETTSAGTSPLTAEGTTSTPGSELITTPKVTTTCEDESCLKCDIDLCQNADDDSTFPLLDSNTAYCVCINKTPEYRECAEGTTYNAVLGVCTSETEHQMPVKCKGDIEDGDFVPNLNNCMLFFICFDGELVESTCGTGNYFNESTKSCTLDTTGICPECSNDQPPKSRSKRSVTKTQSANDNCCPGGYHDGDVIPHPTDCDKKMVCCNGELKEEACGKGHYFNATLKECVKDVNNVCWPSTPSECVEGQVEKHPSNCSMYLSCCDGVVIEKSCDQGYYFNSSEKECVKDTNHICWPNDKPTCDGGFKEDQLVPNSANCSSYFKCSNGELNLQYCIYGYYFSTANHKCVADVNNICWPEEIPTCPGGIKNGHKTENPGDCSSYLICSDGQLNEVQCGKNMVYNKEKAECQPDTNNSCWPKRPTCEGGVKDGDRVPNRADCASYLECSNGELDVVSCGKGMIYNSKKGQCDLDTNNDCWPKEPTCDDGIEEGQKVPIPNKCSSYLECCHGVLREESCEKGMIFNPTVEKCVSDVNNECWPKDTSCEGGVKDGDRIPNRDDCASYLECSNGELDVVSCGKGMIYNSKKGQCDLDTNNDCWPKEPICEGGIEEGQKVPIPNKCSSYLECCHGVLREESCEKGMIFNPTVEKCVSDVNNECWPKDTSCEGGVKDGDRIPNRDDCASYLECSNGELDVVSCGKGMIYNSKKGQCDLDTNNDCWPKEPTCDGGIEEGQKVPIPNKCSSYLECCHGVLREESCEKGMIFNPTVEKCVSDVNNECWPKDTSCEGGVKDGDRIPNRDDCASYLECSNGELDVVSCGKGMIYNSKKGQCDLDTNNDCWPKEPICEGGIEEGQKVPIPNKCSSYLECCHGVLREESCEKGMIFNPTVEKCVSDVNNECWPKDTSCEGGVKDGDRIPNRDDCASYLECSNGELDVVSCGKGMIYNSKKGQCDLDTNNDCWPKEPTCDGGIEEGQKVPIPNKCSSYLECCHGVLREESCEKGMIFNPTVEKCVSDVNNECWPKDTSCEGGVKDGDRIPNRADCASYLECSNGELDVVSCGKGMIYNSKKGQCDLDTNNDCWPKEPTCDDGIEEGQKVPIPNKCSSYLECCHGVLREESCEKGMIFNPTVEKCVSDVNNECWPKDTSCEGGVKDGDRIPNRDDCASYLECSNGELDVVSCGKGMIYNSKKGQCDLDTNNDCWPKEPTCDDGIEEGQKVPIPNKCSSYLECCHGVLREESCEKGMIFNPTVEKCVSDVNNECWPKDTSCEGGVKDGDRIPNRDDCASYLECSNGELDVVSCGKGMIYNSKKGQCDLDTNNDCWPKEPTCDDGIEEGQKVPIPNKCSSYLECCHGVLREESCEKGMIFNPTVEKCVSDVNNECWPKDTSCEGGVKDGDRIPNGADCASYLECSNGELDVVSCGKGMIYNSKKGQCDLDTNNDCWPKEPICEGGIEEGQKVPIPNKCSSYLECCHGVLREESCEKGMIFNPTVEKCVSDVNNECWPKDTSCEGGVKDGDRIPNRDDCASYLECSNGELDVVSCGKGMIYNSKKGQCDLDTNNDCWPKEPICEGGIEEGQKVPIPNKCSSYLECCHGVLREESCEKGMIFNPTVEKCVSDVNNECWPKDTSCEGGVKDGDRIPNRADCASYLECSNGELDVVSCGKGMIYNSKKGQCDLDTKNDCWPKEPTCEDGIEEGQKVPIPKKCSLYLECCDGVLREKFCGSGMFFDSKTNQCKKDEDNICWPKDTCEEGKNVQNPANCSSYLSCCGGKLNIEFCDEGFYFDPDLEKCCSDINNICWPQEASCTCEGKTKALEAECDKMLICTHGQWQVESCGKGYLFNNVTLKCQLDTEHTCWPQQPCTCSGGYEEGETSPAADCDKYYTCSDGVQVLGECGINMYYNATCGTCDPDTERKCWHNYCADQPNGAMVANPKQCNAFYMCNNGESTDEVCETGQLFNATKSACEPDMDAVCYNPCACQDKITILPHPDCTMMYVCNGNQTIVERCPVGGFDITIGDCNPLKKCSDNGCEDKPDYYTYADIQDKTKFYLCLNGVPILKNCLPNTEYNGAVCAHVSDPDCDPTPCSSQEFLTPFATLNGTEENSFCICRKGYATKQYCAAEYVFSPEMEACYSDAPCDPMICNFIHDYFVFSNRDDPKSFCLCADNQAVVVPCPNGGTFNSNLLACSNVTISTQCDQLKCVNQDDYYTYPTDTECIKGFCMCKDHVGTFKNCSENSYFDATMGACRLNNIQCDSSKCNGLANNTKIAALISSQGYCECVNGDATFYNCKNNEEFDAATQECIAPLCDPTKCEKAADYTQFPAVGSRHGFCMCYGQEVVYKPCDEGGVFNTAMLVCQMPLKNCVDSKCVGVADNTKLPADYSVYGYCSCTGGRPTFQECQNGLVFDPASQSCKPENLPIENVCDTTYCDDPAHAGQKYPSINTIYGYCHCSNSGPTFQPCPNGETFDSTLMSCRPSVSSKCDLSLCSDATPNNGYAIPTKTGNTSFCYCTGHGNAMLINCPTDLYYNDKQKKCVATIEEGCSCPGGLHNGDVAPDIKDCTQYYVCNSGIMHQKACLSGQYFNTDCNECQDDTTGFCVKKEACSCLGTYREGERLMHPYNEQMYYVCENKMLQERDCDTGRIFNKEIKQCMRAPHINSRHLQKRSVDVDEFFCLEEEMKRSVPSNCSQYEVCHEHTWKLQSCSPYNYYNPEQMKCLEPRDDTVCDYAKVTNLPECDETIDEQLYKGRTCQQYFRCQKRKWRLNSCPKSDYYNIRVASCLPHHLGEKFECKDLGKETEIGLTPNTCQDLSMRPYAQNCAMYLMCSGNQWWYSYCPLGMYFNRTLNFCLPDVENVCPAALEGSQLVNATNKSDLPHEVCQHEGFLRPSALACNRYYICIGGQWKQQKCGDHNYYDAQLNQCSPDTEGICQQLKADCLPEQKRLSIANCSAYEKCSLDGKWLHWDCPQGKVYDNLLQQCVENDDICSNAGLRKVCNPQETRKVVHNCTQFYYCDEEQWDVASCLKGSMYWPEKQMCVPYSSADKCKPLGGKPLLDDNRNNTNPCAGKLSGVFIGHLSDCTRYYICVNETPSQEMQCASGSFFDASLEYCRPNDGSCRIPLKGECENATENSEVAHPTDCQSYYLCSSVNGQQLIHCPVGQYYHKNERQCRVDHGECKGLSNSATKCFNKTHGTRLADETYCNIYYICVKGMAVPTECPDNYQFNAFLNQCVYDQGHVCHGGKLLDSNLNYSCGNLSDGFYIADREDCTRYYICYAGQAQPKKCSGTTYFDAKQLLCVPGNGSCPFVDIHEPSQYPVPPNPIVCEGRHGNLMPDPVNCNHFYFCINSKLKHDRCYTQFFFNTTLNQCQQKSMINQAVDAEKNTAVGVETQAIAIENPECSINRTSVEMMCKEYGEGATMAEQGDCRFYITCEEEGVTNSQKCRNGESYDSLLGICRQTDGTCQMDSGKRAGECSDRHGQLARDTNNCRKYFVCINGQKVTQSCAEDEYFSKSQNICIKDSLNTCTPEPAAEELTWQTQSCNGLSESILYPYIYDNCRSYFQCVKGVIKLQQCADKLYFDPTAVKCVQNKTECVMPTKSVQRSPIFAKQNYEKLCTQRDIEQPYANIENNCHSFYTCHADGEVSHELCPLGMAFDKNPGRCIPEAYVVCN